MKVSYLMAVYNKKDYVIKSVESILNDCSSSYELEVCIVDDGSSDGSIDLVRESYGKDPRVKIYAFDNNRGKNSAYNKAFKMCSGDYVSIVGADDEIIPGRTQILLDRSLVSDSAVYGGLIKRNLVDGREMLFKPPRKPCFYDNIVDNTLSGGCFLAPRSMLEGVFPIPEDLLFEDWWLSFHLLRCYSVVTLDSPVLMYNIYDNNDNGVFQPTKESLLRDYQRHEKYLEYFSIYLKSKKSKKYLKRSKEIRCSVIRKDQKKISLSSLGSLFSYPYDKTLIRLYLLRFFGVDKYFLSLQVRDKLKAFFSRSYNE